MRTGKTLRTTLWLFLLLGLLLMPGCGSGADSPDDEDGDAATDPGDNSVLGDWKQLDASESLIPWFAAQNSSALYLRVEKSQLTWRFVGQESENRCQIFPVTRSTTTRFVLTQDAESCRYDLTLVEGSAKDVLQVEARHKDDPTLRTYMFRFQRVAYLPAEAAGACETLNVCPRYDTAQASPAKD